MRRLFWFSLLAFLSVLSVSPTFSQDVRTSYMPGTDFTKYKTYHWGLIEGGAHPNQIVDAEIKQAVDNQLADKGFLKIDEPKADLTVSYQVAVDRERQWNGFGSGGIRWGGMGTATSSTIPIGTIVLDFYDPNSKELVWQGRATKTIDANSKQEKQEKALNKAMKKLLKDFPPTPKKK
jgi:Domain of unknown function (DUF4136)